jgi:hypothetical protein
MHLNLAGIIYRINQPGEILFLEEGVLMYLELDRHLLLPVHYTKNKGNVNNSLQGRTMDFEVT